MLQGSLVADGNGDRTACYSVSTHGPVRDRLYTTCRSTTYLRATRLGRKGPKKTGRVTRHIPSRRTITQEGPEIAGEEQPVMTVGAD